MSWMEWYQSLAKPAWTPEPSTIRWVWWILYPVIGVSFGFVFTQTIRGRLAWKRALPFAVNLVANLAFTPLLFGARDLRLAAGDILLVWATIPWMAAVVWPRHRWVALAQVPYFVWVSIATLLQLSIAFMNA